MGEAGGPRGEGKSPPGSQEEGSEAGLLRGRWYLALGAGLSAMSELLSVAIGLSSSCDAPRTEVPYMPSQQLEPAELAPLSPTLSQNSRLMPPDGVTEEGTFLPKCLISALRAS